jgi:hypothetical protein
MRHSDPQKRRCSYVIVIGSDQEPAGDLRELASYLSMLAIGGCDVIVVDGSESALFDDHGRTLRWVARHVAARPRHRNFTGGLDVVRAAIDVSNCEKIIVAGAKVRYDDETIERVCGFLDDHEVVEPQDYFQPLPWWSGIEAGRMLVHRGIEPLPDHGATFGLRKSSIRGLRGLDVAWSNGEHPVRRLSSRGAEVFSACDVFVRRLPPALTDWLQDRPKQAGEDFAVPVKTTFFFALLPLAIVIAICGGVQLAGSYAGTIALATIALAIRGRGGAATFFPIRACLCAPLWVIERSVSVYWALFQRLQAAPTDAVLPPIAERGPHASAVNGK